MKTLKKVLLGILILVAAFVVFLVVSVMIDSVIGANRLDEVPNVTIPGTDGGPDVRAYVARPEGEGPFPTVIMIHEFFGLNESIIGKADLLAEEGYLVVAPDTFRGLDHFLDPACHLPGDHHQAGGYQCGSGFGPCLA